MPRKSTGAITGKAKGENQDTRTPPEVVAAVIARFGPLAWDLAASDNNYLLENYLTQQVDSLTVPWNYLELPEGAKYSWLNPPFEDILPWALKCLEESRAGFHSLMLAPAATDTEYFRLYCLGRGFVHFLNGRLVFWDPSTGQPHKRQSKCECGFRGVGAKGRKDKCGRLECGKWDLSPYPKPCMVVEYGPDVVPGVGWWDWKRGEAWSRYLTPIKQPLPEFLR